MFLCVSLILSGFVEANIIEDALRAIDRRLRILGRAFGLLAEKLVKLGIQFIRTEGALGYRAYGIGRGKLAT